MVISPPFLVVHQVIWYSLKSRMQHYVSNLGLREGDVVLLIELQEIPEANISRQLSCILQIKVLKDI